MGAVELWRLGRNFTGHRDSGPHLTEAYPGRFAIDLITISEIIKLCHWTATTMRTSSLALARSIR